ncbi:glycosyltransferase [Staphylococcus cohnii]
MTTYMLMYSLPEKAGGITSVMLNRSKILQEKGVPCKLLTLDDKNYDNLRIKLKNTGRLHESVKIINIYEELENLNDVKDKEINNQNKLLFEKLNTLDQEGFYVQKNEFDEHNYARYFKNNKYVMYKKWVSNKLSHIDYFENRKRVTRHIFKNSILRKEITFDKDNNMSEMKYLSNDGFCYLMYWFGKNERVVNIFKFNRNTKEVLNFKNNKQFHSYWLDNYLTYKDTLILDGIGTYPKVENMKNSEIKKIFTIHTNHFEYPYKYGAEIKPEFEKMLNNLRNLDALVVLTEQQKNDIIKQFGNYNNVHVIPNAVNYAENLDIKKNNNNSIVVLQRFVKMKNIDQIIKSMAIVRRKIKDVKLNIYGTGPQKQEYIELIKNLNLQDHVFINEYTFDLQEVYLNASLSVLTSEYEGISMSILESMSFGVPVVSYPVNYGPEFIIKNNVDGIITKEFNNIEELAKKITYLLKNNRTRYKLSENARLNIKNNFSHQAVAHNWVDIIKKT